MERSPWFIQMGSKCNHKCPYKGKTEKKTQKVTMRQQKLEATLLASGDHKLRHAGRHWKAGKCKEMESPLEAPEEAWPGQHFDFGPV